jgi:hypothetical protein
MNPHCAKGSKMTGKEDIAIFDGHNDSVQYMSEYRGGGRNFLMRSDDGHLDLARARDGGLIGGLFAMFAKPEHAPADDLTITKSGYGGAPCRCVRSCLRSASNQGTTRRALPIGGAVGRANPLGGKRTGD